MMAAPSPWLAQGMMTGRYSIAVPPQKNEWRKMASRVTSLLAVGVVSCLGEILFARGHVRPVPLLPYL